MRCAEDIQRVTLRAGHSLYYQDYHKKRSYTEVAREVEEGKKRLRRSFLTEDNQDDYIDNRIYLAGESFYYKYQPFIEINYYQVTMA